MIRSLMLSLLVCSLAVAAPPAAKERPYIARLRRKANNGIAQAQFDLGVCYRFGQGVSQNETEAVAWFRKAADKGLDAAQYNLGVMLDAGRGLAQDHVEAARWYLKAALQGHAKAQHNLGVSYKHGLGVPRDPVEAYVWFEMAAKNGIEIAWALRDQIGEDLTPPDKARAQMRDQEIRAQMKLKKPRKAQTREGQKTGSRKGKRWVYRAP